jgi:hypothetical protein
MMPHCFDIDFAQTPGTVKLFNSVNKAPIRNTLRVPKSFGALEVPLVRLHDCPFDTHGVVDFHYLFPCFHADPDDPAAYCFAKTDDYIRAILDAGSGVYFRLGESIEHSPNKYFVHPPRDFNKWARVCVNIIRHYRRGWADGFEWPIEYWEIWNEPDLGPRCWTGTPEQYHELYAVAAKAIKESHPDVKVGGPAGCSPFDRGFLEPFLSNCVREGAPLDFFSWHRYSNDPGELARAAGAAAQLLAEYGLAETENHCNEWNYFPDKRHWAEINDPDMTEAAAKVFEEIGGAKGAAFDAASIVLAQDSPLDLAMFYTGDSTRFGIYRDGVPRKNYFVLLAMKAFRKASGRAGVAGQDESRGLALLAGASPDGSRASMLLSNYAHEAQCVRLRLRNAPWPAPTALKVRLLDERRSLECVRDETSWVGDEILVRGIEAPSVCLITIGGA